MISVCCGHMPRQSNKDFLCRIMSSFRRKRKKYIKKIILSEFTLNMPISMNLRSIIYSTIVFLSSRSFLRYPWWPEWTNVATWLRSQPGSPHYHELYYMWGNTAKKGGATQMLPIFRKFAQHRSLNRKTARAKTWNDSRMYNKRQLNK